MKKIINKVTEKNYSWQKITKNSLLLKPLPKPKNYANNALVVYGFFNKKLRRKILMQFLANLLQVLDREYNTFLNWLIFKEFLRVYKSIRFIFHEQNFKRNKSEMWSFLNSLSTIVVPELKNKSTLPKEVVSQLTQQDFCYEKFITAGDSGILFEDICSRIVVWIYFNTDNQNEWNKDTISAVNIRWRASKNNQNLGYLWTPATGWKSQC